MNNEEDIMTPIGWTKKPFQGWTDSMLDGYIIMTQEQVNSCIFPRGRESFQTKLNDAIAEREFRKNNKIKQQEETIHSEVIMKEEVDRTYNHEMSGTSNPESTENGD